NKLAKDSFFSELFYELDIETIFMRIRKINIRSIKAAEKLQYVNLANETRKAVYDEINANEEVYNLYEIPKDQYTLATMRDTTFQDAHQLKEA
ncbi:N-acetyltransferase, partial [Bacillus paramycoides]|nr:N-acetyltransferase [Bacillus cereus]